MRFDRNVDRALERLAKAISPILDNITARKLFMSLRLGLAKAVDWETLGYEIVGTAANGFKAMDVINSRPVDVVLTDIRMPKMSGIELSSLVVEKFPSIKVVILSGYSDFNYARQAIKNNVFDYLLKPSKENEIIDIFTRLRNIIEKEKKNKNLMNTNSADMIQRLLINLVLRDKSIEEANMQDLADFFPKLFQAKKTVITLEISICSLCVEEYRNFQLRFCNDHIRGMIGRYSKIGFQPVFFMNNNEVSYIIAVDADEDLNIETDKLFRHISNEVDGTLEREVNIALTGGVSLIYTDICDTGKCYVQSKDALKHKVYCGKGRLIHYDKVQAVSPVIPDMPVRDIAVKIVQCIYSKKFTEAAGFLKAFFNTLRNARIYSMEPLYILCYKLLHYINENFRDLGLNGEKIIGPEDAIINSIREIDTIDELDLYFKDIVDRCAENMQEFDTDVIRKIIETAVQYIKREYCSGIRLDVMARHLNISANYLCRLFKKELNVNFKDYLIDLRLDRARELLTESDLRVYEISETVGYMDQRYFSELFKCRTGMTPLEYREKVRDGHG